MKPVLIVYSTTDGHTRKIAYFVQETILNTDQQTEIHDAADLPHDFDITKFQAAILAGSLHQAKHQTSLTHFARKYGETLNKIPTLFLSASLTAIAHDESHTAEANKCIQEFANETGFFPLKTYAVAGALKYVEYDWLKRMVMKSIVKKEGGDIDTSQDYEYTDWPALKDQILDFLNELPG
ncbi:MAG: flavodoxin domain-containing protein [Fimbriimonadaceae bacterium]